MEPYYEFSHAAANFYCIKPKNQFFDVPSAWADTIHVPLGNFLLQQDIAVRDVSKYPGIEGWHYRIAERTSQENKAIVAALIAFANNILQQSLMEKFYQT